MFNIQYVLVNSTYMYKTYRMSVNQPEKSIRSDPVLITFQSDLYIHTVSHLVDVVSNVMMYFSHIFHPHCHAVVLMFLEVLMTKI